MSGFSGAMKGAYMPTNGSQKHPPDVTVYTTPHCQWCDEAKRYLSQNGIAYREVDVSDRSAARREMLLMTGCTTVPVIKVGAHAMTGWNEREFTTLMAGTFKQR